MKWNGIVADTTDVDETPGVSAYQVNTRMKVDGELQRRYGMIAALPQMSGPILGIAGGNGFIVSDVAGGTVDGTADPIGVMIGPIVFPPVVVPTRVGGAWAMNGSSSGLPWTVQAHVPCNELTSSSNPECAGSVTVHVFNAGGTPGETYGTLKNLNTNEIIDHRMLTGMGFQYTVAVPFRPGAQSLGYQTTTTNFADFAADFSISRLESYSSRTCSAQWTFDASFNVNAITIFDAFSLVSCNTTNCSCAGKLTINLSSITGTGTRVTAFRHNGMGGTAPFDTRDLPPGTASYVLDVPANNIFTFVSVNIEPVGGSVAGTIIGGAMAGCG